MLKPRENQFNFEYYKLRVFYLFDKIFYTKFKFSFYYVKANWKNVIFIVKFSQRAIQRVTDKLSYFICEEKYFYEENNEI